MKNILFICSHNQWRSPTAEKVYSKDPRVHARSAGTSPKARHTVNAKIINGTATGEKSIADNNLLGKITVSQNSYNNIPNVHNEKMTIYYLIKEADECKQMHELFFNRRNIKFSLYSLDRDNKDIPYEYRYAY